MAENEYTPTTDEMKEILFQHFSMGLHGLSDEARVLVTRAFAVHDAQVRAEAWDEGEQAGLRRADFEYGHATIQAVKRNPYRTTPTETTNGDSDEL